MSKYQSSYMLFLVVCGCLLSSQVLPLPHKMQMMCSKCCTCHAKAGGAQVTQDIASLPLTSAPASAAADDDDDDDAADDDDDDHDDDDDDDDDKMMT